MTVSTFRTVTTADTNEPVQVTCLTDYHMNGGYDWMDDIEGTGFVVPGLWGRDGYDLGDWPYLICAVARSSDTKGRLFGMATYCEGDVETTWYRNQAAQWQAITEWAFSHWKRGQSDGPPNLPATAAELHEDYTKPMNAYKAPQSK